MPARMDGGGRCHGMLSEASVSTSPSLSLLDSTPTQSSALTRKQTSKSCADEYQRNAGGTPSQNPPTNDENDSDKPIETRIDDLI